MRRRLKRLLPKPESVRDNRWLRWLGPTLHHPRLWHLSRRGIALGFSLGVFFGLLFPIAQIPLAAAAAVMLRANVPVAIASTFVSNPVTFPAIYYGAYRLGAALVGEDERMQALSAPEEGAAWPDPLLVIPPIPDAEQLGWIKRSWLRLRSLGKPLLVGIAIIAISGGLLAYLAANWAWRLNTSVAWRRRVRERQRRKLMSQSAPQEPPAE
ncbi:MAG: DUF2062 domain-containing protein [Aquimonas sp.]|nr:DUF2062 domain-containing protein [Aquimonas sp.]